MNSRKPFPAMTIADSRYVDVFRAALRPALACALLLALPFAAQAEPVLLDRIAVIVDDDVVMDSDIARRMADVREQISTRGARQPPEDVLRKQVMDRLILESIQVQLATRMGARIDDDTLNGSIEGIARQNGITLRDFIARLGAEGIDYESFREEVRRDMLMKSVRQRRVGDRVRVTDADVEEFLRSADGRDLFSGSYRLAHILVAVPEGGDVPAVQAAATKAADLARQARDGADFADLAVRNSEAANALEGGDLGWRTGAQLPSLFATLVLDMKPGDIAGPLRSSSGFHLVKMIDRKLGEERVVQQAKVRHVLVKPSALRNSAEARTTAQHLLDRVVRRRGFRRRGQEKFRRSRQCAFRWRTGLGQPRADGGRVRRRHERDRRWCTFAGFRVAIRLAFPASAGASRPGHQRRIPQDAGTQCGLETQVRYRDGGLVARTAQRSLHRHQGNPLSTPP
jgi:peptidyl-prolyl cis-trans isomerase SurA